MKIRAWHMGNAVQLDHLANQKSAVLEVELDDGRTVQLTVGDDGSVYLRGWGNVPSKLGNVGRLCLSAHVAFEEPPQ